VHMLRKAVIHGIAPHDERRTGGRSEVGRIHAPRSRAKGNRLRILSRTKAGDRTGGGVRGAVRAVLSESEAVDCSPTSSSG